MRIVFMGSPSFAVPSLEALVEARQDVRLVVTQPDRAAGRGRKLLETAVKSAARALELPVMEFDRGARRRVTEAVLAQRPDAVIVAAFGHILRDPILSAPPYGCINVHASLLPRWRGVAPVQYAILNGDPWTGVTIMEMDAGVDTGPILAQRGVPIAPDETATEVIERLAGVGADLLVYTLRKLEQGLVRPIPQDDRGAVYAPKLNRSLSPLRWDRDVITVHNQIRALQPYPGTATFLGDEVIRIIQAQPHSFRTATEGAGTVLAVDDEGVLVACGEGVLQVCRLQVPGRRDLPVADFLRGFSIEPGQVFHS
ncbi:MAG: methionyl-tRNA formyltransferase [Candidatus Krumholzibacteriia bacterium]